MSVPHNSRRDDAGPAAADSLDLDALLNGIDFGDVVPLSASSIERTRNTAEFEETSLDIQSVRHRGRRDSVQPATTDDVDDDSDLLLSLLDSAPAATAESDAASQVQVPTPAHRLRANSTPAVTLSPGRVKSPR